MFKELEAIAIAVVGGILMTGGFGSIVGVIFGAVTFGLVANAVFFIPGLMAHGSVSSLAPFYWPLCLQTNASANVSQEGSNHV